MLNLLKNGKIDICTCFSSLNAKCCFRTSMLWPRLLNNNKNCLIKYYLFTTTWNPQHVNDSDWSSWVRQSLILEVSSALMDWCLKKSWRESRKLIWVRQLSPSVQMGGLSVIERANMLSSSLLFILWLWNIIYEVVCIYRLRVLDYRCLRSIAHNTERREQCWC